MVHTEVITHWVYEHYLIYLYLCVADANCIISNIELSRIQQKAFKNLDEDRCSKLISEVFREYRSHSQEERKEYIRDNVNRFLRTDSIRKKVIGQLEETITEKSDSGECVMFRYIRRIINSVRSS